MYAEMNRDVIQIQTRVEEDGVLGAAAGIQLWMENSGPRKTDGTAEEAEDKRSSLLSGLALCLSDSTRTTNNATEGKVAEEIHVFSAQSNWSLREEIVFGMCSFMMAEICVGREPLIDELQEGLDKGFEYYMRQLDTTVELAGFSRLRNLYDFQNADIAWSDHTDNTAYGLEAAVWSLITTTSFQHAVLKSLDLDAESYAATAITGSLAGVFYGDCEIPSDWLDEDQKGKWINRYSVEKERIFTELGRRG